ncbi:FtsK/SpoIIIE domain-containing protein [Microbacterium thalassium]|uniref:S-DNA-T family DNA segregation ATPase FtsK/SpoIIIE n=1 Tax=Microbacterium thalassium TaxID=362649 RepID=A0A7X0FQX0_9MICO|nr:FtsK/SpoIIIE domain-containing protein [Microbacterium thalassium]MBB6391436.1 S-DNA-T family DNA segregation ATPase FtsK/SpoIIIE [Microbacterium thalassium]
MPDQIPVTAGLVRTAPLAPDDPLSLPDAWTPPARPGFPLVAAVVPVAGGVVMWLVTGSTPALWLAALGPLLAIGSILDARRTARRDRRKADDEARRARAAVVSEVARRHEHERAARWAEHPDVARMLTSDAGLWRIDSTRAEAIVVGAGEQPSAVRVLGGQGDPAAAQVRADASWLAHAPVTVPAHAGVAVTGDAFVARAVLRALAVQLCLSAAPGELRVLGSCSEHEWIEAVPHRRASRGRALALVAPGEPVPAEADVVLARVGPGEPPPPRCGALLEVRGLTSGTIDHAGRVQEVGLEAVGDAQAAAIAAMLEARAGAAFGVVTQAVPFHALDRTADATRGGLPATIGVGDRGPVSVDLVDDGPHAVVAGVTGSGKSELLITWILALCAARSTDDVSFLLADFKGGTAFDALRTLPHVTGVITDLDGAGARRAIDSLRAELRRRESALASAGARDIADPRVALPRLVVVVDEFAALLAAQPELHAVFADVAARGRALGMHLILGTQRAAGVIRDALLANCPLRVSLRVTDRADSRAVVGTDDAAELDGGPGGRGVALVRRASDASPHRVRIALSAPDDITAVAARASGPAPRRPWLPPLPDRVVLDDVVAGRDTGTLVIGLSDEPDRQRQRRIGLSAADRGVLVIGGPGSGRTTALETLARQAPHVVRIGPAAEHAWDALERLDEEPPAAGSLVLADDVDAVIGGFPPEYAQECAARFERVARAAGRHGILVAASVQRLSGPVARIADLFPRRLLLRTASRADHFAAGGDPAQFSAAAAPGRGTLDGVAVQVALAPGVIPGSQAPAAPWHPRAALTGFVTRRSAAAREAMAAWERGGHRVIGLDAFAADGHPGEPVVVAGDPEQWQRHWRVLGDIRADHDLVVDAPCAGELRALTGSRRLPPYAEPGRARAWLLAAGDDAVRIPLPAADAEAGGAGAGGAPPHR